MINLLDYMIRINDLFGTSHAFDAVQELIDQFDELEGYEAWEIPVSTLYEDGDGEEFVAISMINEDEKYASLYLSKDRLEFVPWDEDGEDIEEETKILYRTPTPELLKAPISGGYMYVCPNRHKMYTAKHYSYLTTCPECRRKFGLTSKLQCSNTFSGEYRNSKVLYPFARYVPDDQSQTSEA